MLRWPPTRITFSGLRWDCFAVAVVLNLVGLNIGKWLQNAGGVSTYVPLLMLIGIGWYFAVHHGSASHFDWKSSLPVWNLDTVNFWSNIAFAFTGMELVCAMSEEVRDPKKTFPRAIYASAVMIALIYIVATVALLALLPADKIDVRNGVFQGISGSSAVLGIAWFGVIAALLVTVGTRAVWALRWPEWRASRLWRGSTPICLHSSAGFTQNGRLLMFLS